MAQLKVGQKAPHFSLPAGDGTTIDLDELKGKTVVLYFYPKDNTSGCTKEACSFQENVKTFTRKGAVIIGVSADSVKSHKKFAQKYHLAFPLVSDAEKKLVKLYGVWKEKSLYGRKYMGVERSTFVIDPQGVITHIFSKVKVNGHTDQVLAALTNPV
jgi:thioredoxin-dependent peroxiredoxin